MTAPTGALQDWRTQRGRPRKLADAAPVILDAIARGMTREAAAQAAGVSRNTLHVWLTTEDDECLAFRDAVQMARDAGTARLLAKIEAAGDADARNWTAHAWILERTRPDQFALRTRVDITSVTLKLDAYLAELGLDPSSLDTAARDRIVASVAKQLAEPR